MAEGDSGLLSGEGSWWRYSAYDIEGGLIVPAAGATLEEYSPWTELREGFRHRSDYKTAYIELSEHSALWRHADGRWKLVHAAILDWCSRHGLLGSLLHELHDMWLAPRWSDNEFFLDPPDVTMVPMAKHYGWGPRGWVEDHVPVTVSSSVIQTVAEGARAGAVLEPGAVQRIQELDPYSPLPAAGVGAYLQEYGLLRSGGSPETIFEPLDGDWVRQFAVTGDPYAFDYPLPASPSFWAAYREPVSHFCWYAGEIVEALAGLGAHGTKGRAADAATVLNQLAYPAQLRLVADRDGELRQTWETPSLISALAVMGMVDATGGRYIGRCESCERLFVTRRPERRFCCKQHQDQAKKRRRRAKSESPTEEEP